jgi:hypothetical protein
MWILIVIVLAVLWLVLKDKSTIPPPTPPPNPPEPVPDPDPHPWKWPLIDDTTQRWADYCEYMQRITTDTLVALEMKFYKWVSDWDLWNKPDHWALPDVVWVNKKDDCDGLARLSCDMLGRFVKIPEVWWLEYYGFYREYYKKDGEWLYRIKAGGHAITVYRKEGELLAFSNMSWWNNQNFQDFIEIGELTFPEGLYWVICRHWETGIMKWQMKSGPEEIMEGTNVFYRKLKLIRNLKPLKRGESKKVKKLWEKT